MKPRTAERLTLAALGFLIFCVIIIGEMATKRPGR